MNNRWNMLIIVIFVMIITSLFGILTTRYVNSIIQYGSAFHNYYKAYYLANAPLQLQLLKQKNRWLGFEDKILTWSSTFSNNFDCENCFFESELLARNSIIIDESEHNLFPSDCDLDNSNHFALAGWKGTVIPLFWDQNTWEGSVNLINIKRLPNLGGLNIKKTSSDTNNYVIWIIDEKLNSSSVDDINFVNTLSIIDESINNYLVIANNTWNAWKSRFCINDTNNLPTTHININSLWKFQNTYVSLRAKRSIQLPEYLIYSIVE